MTLYWIILYWKNKNDLCCEYNSSNEISIRFFSLTIHFHQRHLESEAGPCKILSNINR